MCGILAIASRRDSPLRTSEAVALQMREAMRLRGPDASGLLNIDGRVWLGHRLLAIRDPAHGQQPWVSVDGRWSLVFNGEIYNTEELRELTARQFHAPPRTHCDTELLLRAIQVYRLETPRLLRGMFAYVAYDRQTKTMFLARDRFGIKPLYYTLTAHELLAASSPAALLRHPELTRTVNSRALLHYLVTLRTNLEQETLFESIQSLPPGHQLIFRDGQLNGEQYWDYPETREPVAFEQSVSDLQTELRTATRIRLVSDVPVGMMLSGGVDSCLLGSFVQEQLGSRFVAECGVGIGGEEGESRFAARAAEHFDCQFRTVYVSADEYRAGWCELVRQTGLPLTTPSDVIIYRLAQSLKQQVGVVLGGEGADELFRGYAALHGLGWQWERGEIPPATAAGLTEAYFQRASILPFAALHQLLRRDSREQFAEIQATYRKILDPEPDSESADAHISGLQRISHLLHRYNLEALLTRLDQATMAASLEARVPFTDHQLVERFWNLPAEGCFAQTRSTAVESLLEQERAGDFTTKRLLRALAGKRLPVDLARRPKASFPTPVLTWLAGPWREWGTQLIRNSPLLDDLIHPEPLSELLNHPEQAGLALWPLLNLAVWEQHSV